MGHFGHGSSARDEAIGRIVTSLYVFETSYLEALALGLEAQVDQGAASLSWAEASGQDGAKLGIREDPPPYRCQPAQLR